MHSYLHDIPQPAQQLIAELLLAAWALLCVVRV